MRVFPFIELDGMFRNSGIGSAVENQKKALSKAGVEISSTQRDGFDILHINTMGPKSIYLMKKYKGKKKIVITAHTLPDDLKESFLMSTFISTHFTKYFKFFYSQADVIIAPTEFTKRVLQKRLGIKTRIEVLSNGVDTGIFNETVLKRRDSARKALRMRGVCVFAVGHVFVRKGIQDFNRVAERIPEAQFFWFGNMFKGITEGGTLKIVKNSPPNVKYAGRIDDIRDAYAAGDIFFFPTKVETEGMVVLEAAACGKPIVIRDIECFDGWLQDGKNCLKAKTLGGLEEKIRALMGDSALGDSITKEAKFVAEERSLDNIGKRLKSIYGSLF